MIREFDWLIHYRCNYRCPYCFFEGMWPEVEKRNVRISAETWVAAWRRIHRKYGEFKLTITGGEPFRYPRFGFLLGELSRIARVSFDTNLSCSERSLRAAVKPIDPSRLFMGLSFHPTHAVLKEFMKKVEFLQRSGVDFRVHLVAYPPHLKDLKRLKATFVDAGFRFVPIPFRGTFKGSSYPHAFSAKQKALIYDVNRSLVAKDRIWSDRQVEQVRSRNKRCHAGQYYARVDCEGTVYPCGNDYTKSREKYIVGNMLDKQFKLRRSPMVCRQETCPCEFRWIVKETPAHG
jgi:MoaA/NifB/PqqE/SkfB family radical SAM enzyme